MLDADNCSTPVAVGGCGGDIFTSGVSSNP